MKNDTMHEHQIPTYASVIEDIKALGWNDFVTDANGVQQIGFSAVQYIMDKHQKMMLTFEEGACWLCELPGVFQTLSMRGKPAYAFAVMFRDFLAMAKG